MAPRRLYVEQQVYPRFLELLEREIAAVRVANPLSEGCELGPVRTEALREGAISALAEAASGGAKRMRGGEALPGSGYYLSPALVAGCTDEMRVFQADLMAPVVAVAPIARAESELERVNAHRSGLTASVWTGSRTRGRALAAVLPGGVISINDVLLPAAHPDVPFGGGGDGGYGRMRGAAGLREMVRPRVTDEGPGRNSPRRHLFPYRAGTVDLLRASVTMASGAPGSRAQGFVQWVNAVRRYGREK
jgi:acyl-CoA reductase-like NAD-dependent aldehyde dehydrogenase